MKNTLCMNCFKVKGEYEVCPHCGYVEGTPPTQAYHLTPGTMLQDRYLIGVCIGFGGFGITYHAYDLVLNIPVAIKEFYPSGLVNRAPGDTKVGIFSGEKEKEFKIQLARFLDEARNMAIFSKERDIVNVYHFFEANGTAYTIMEYIDGILLKTYLKENGKMEVPDALSYMVPILDALEKIHRHGIIHKDISPDNIFLTGPGSVKIFDFGAARFPDGQQDKTFSVVIKAGYAPPEQYRANYEPGAFMDIYAAGAVFYEMITGVRPSEGSDRMIEDDLVAPSKLGVDIDKNLEKIIRKAMAVKPENRFQTAQEFKDCILKNTEVVLPEEELKQKVQKKARKIGIIAAGAAVVAVGAMVGIFSFMGKGKLHPDKLKTDTLTFWLMEDGQEDGMAEVLKEEYQKECKKITLEITEVPREEYAARVQKASEDGTLPDVFCTDFLSDEAQKWCADLQKVYHTLDLEQYTPMEQPQEAYEVPTGFQVATAYENVEKYQQANEKTDDKITVEELKKAGAVFTTEYEKFGAKEDSMRLMASDLSAFPEIQKVTVQAVPSQELAVVPVVDSEGKLNAVFCDSYGVNKQSSANRQEAGMILITYLLNKNIQEKTWLSNYQALPVHKEALQQYREIKATGYLNFLNEYLDQLSFQEGNSIQELYDTKPDQ